MTNYDLGTAHGRIKIDVDDRGAQQAQNVFANLEKTMQSLDRRLATMQLSMNRMESEIRGLAQEFRKANEEVENLENSVSELDSGFQSAGRSSRSFASEVHQTAAKVIMFTRVAQRVIPPLQMLRTVFNSFNNSNFGNTFGLLSGIFRSGAIAMGFKSLTSRILGFNKAMQNASGWQRSLMKFAGTITAISSGFGFINFLSRGRLGMATFAKAAGFAATFVGDLSDKIQKIGAKFGTFSVASARAFAKVSEATNSLSRGIIKTFDISTRMGRGMVNLAQGATGVAVGFGLMRHGATRLLGLFKNLGWAGKVFLASVAAMATIGPAALEVFGKALVGTSNLLLGLANGVKQLAGGFLVLPGAISMVVAAFSSLRVVFGGLADSFKDIFKLDDPDAALEGLMKLPPHLKALGQAFYNLRQPLSLFKKNMQEVFLTGAEKQVEALASNYLPLLYRGMASVATSARVAKDRLVEFLLEAQTKQDTEKIYNLTAQAFLNLSQAIKPAARGMQDIAVVGAEFITQLSSGIGDLARKFAVWASENRKNDNMLDWISNSWTGVKNLTRGVIDASKAIWKLLTLFATNNGDNFFQRFANSMKKFNETVQRSAAEGTLKKIGDYVRNLGSESIAKLADVFRSLFDAANDAAPVIKQIGEYSGAVLVPAIKMASQAIELLFWLLDASQLAPIIGVLGGLATAFLVLKKLCGPVAAGIHLITGALVFMGGTRKLIQGVADVIYNFGAVGRFAAAGIGMLAAAFNALLIVVALVAAAYMSYKANADYIKTSNDLISDSLENTTKNYKKLQEAFVSDRGKMGKTTMDQIKENVQSNMDFLEQQAEKAPGMWEHFNNFMSTAGKDQEGGFGQSVEFNFNQRIFDDAKKIKEAFEEIGVSQDEVAAAIAQGGPAYENLISRLQDVGYSGELAAGQLYLWREEVEKSQKAAAELGEGGLAVVDGLNQIAGAAGDANAKLNGLKTILEGLGIVKTNALQTAAAYAQGIRSLQQEVQEALVPGESLSDIIDKQTGSFNTNSQSATNLINVFASLSQQYMNAISQGKDAGEAYATFESQLDGVAQTLGITKEQLKRLAQEAGMFDPKTLQGELNEFLNAPNKKPYLIDLGIDKAKLEELKNQMPNLLGDLFSGQGNGPHGGYNDRVRAEAQKSKEETETEFKNFAERLTATLNGEAEKAEEAGSKFSEALGKGIESNPAAVNAARDMAEKLRKQFHQSPPKEGPLSAHGDAALYGGKMFVKSYAQGITGSLSYVKKASGRVATIVSDGLVVSSGASAGGSNQPGSGAGKFFGDLLEIAAFASRFTGVIEKISDTMFKALKFASDPLGKGTFFGKQLGFKKTVSDSELERRRQDRLQQDSINMWDSGRRNLDGYDQRYGMPKITGPGKLSRDASSSDIQAAIVAEGQRRGLDEKQIIAALAIADHESNYGKNTFGAGHGAFLPGGGKGNAYGVFQQTPEGGWGTPEQLMDPNYAITKFFDAYTERLKTETDPLIASVLTQNPQLAGNVLGQDYTNITQSKMGDAAKILSEILKSGATVPTQAGGAFPGVPSVGAFGRPSVLEDYDGVKSTPASVNAAAFISALFPEIQKIGGGRSTGTAPNTHDIGQAIDIMMPRKADGSFDMELGDRINAVLKQNAEALNIRYTIWRDVGQNIKDGTKFSSGGHQDHIDVQFNDGSVGSIGPNGTNLKVPYGTSGMIPDSLFGPPLEPGSTIAPPNESIKLGPNGELVRVHNPDGSMPGEPLNRATGKPWTEEERAAFFEQYPKEFELGNMTLEQIQEAYQNDQYAQGGSEDILNQLKKDSLINEAYALNENPQNYTDDQIIDVLSNLDTRIADLGTQDTPKSRYEKQALESLQSSITEATGYTRQENPIDTMAGIASNVAGVASDIIGTVTTGLEAVGAADNIAKSLVRGLSGTKDVDNVIDNVQKFIELGGRIAGSVASVSGLAGSIAGAASSEPSGGAAGAAAALGSVSTIASLIQAGWETVNAVIDLSQEAIRIAGGYVGDFLGYLTGGAGGQLAGDVKFLLDKQTNQLLTYSAENSMDKRTHNVPFAKRDMASREQKIGSINVYGGPGSDPRDLTRQMMFQVNAAQYAGALSQ